MERDWQVVHLRLERSDYEALMEMAEEDNRSVSHEIRHLVKQGVVQRRDKESSTDG